MNAVVQQSQLTDMQRFVVRKVGRGMSWTDACKLAETKWPKEDAFAMQRLPHVQAAVVAELRRFLICEAGPGALGILWRFANDEKLEAKLRIACAKTVADRAGLIAPKAAENKGLDRKGISDMTGDELRQASQDILKEMADRSKPIVIDNAPQPSADAPYPFDMLD